MNENELNQEIGELIVELISWGHSVEIVPIGKTEHDGTSVKVPGISFIGSVPLSELGELLGLAVDQIRIENGEPTRSEQVELMLKEDAAGCCPHCGNRGVANIEMKASFHYHFSTGRVLPLRGLPDVGPNDLLSCDSCGQWFKLVP